MTSLKWLILAIGLLLAVLLMLAVARYCKSRRQVRVVCVRVRADVSYDRVLARRRKLQPIV